MDTTDAAVSGSSRNNQARKSMPPNLSTPVMQENASSQSSAPTSTNTLISTPQPSRNRDRRARTAASASAQASKSSTRSKSHATPSGDKMTTKSATPSKPFQLSTPSNPTTGSRREDRISAAATATPNTTKQTPSASTQDAENQGSTTASQAKDNGSSRAQRSSNKPRPSNTVTLTLGRKSLESVLNRPLGQIYNHEIVDSVEATPVHVYNDNYHFDYDSEMYKNNYGLDGQVDAPTSPTSFSTTTSTAARTSGRARKPTIRALESIESEKRFRRTRGTSVKAESSTAEPSAGEPRPKPKTALKSTASAPQILSRPDLSSIGKQLFELAAAAVSDDYTPVREAEAWWEEMRHEWKKMQQEKEKQPAQAVQREGEKNGFGEQGGESRPTSNNPSIQDLMQGSKDSWTDADGWMYTGQVNQYGEEYVVVPVGFDWYRPNNTYGDDQLPLPPVRLRSHDQAEKDRVFGFPPRIGERNVPREVPFMFEDVNQERAKIRAREAAKVRGIAIDRSMSLADIEALIIQHDATAGFVPSATPQVSSRKASKEPPSRKRRRAETTSNALKVEPTEPTQKPKRRRQETTTDTPKPPPTTSTSVAPETPAQKPSLKIKFTFSKGSVVAAAANQPPEKSKKRPHSETEDPASEVQDARSTKTLKLTAPSGPSNGEPSTRAAPSTPQAAATNSQSNNEGSTTTPGAAEQYPTETPGGRPLRRAAAALMAGFQHHADERARRANARKKATSGDKREESPLKKYDPITMD